MVGCFVLCFFLLFPIIFPIWTYWCTGTDEWKPLSQVSIRKVAQGGWNTLIPYASNSGIGQHHPSFHSHYQRLRSNLGCVVLRSLPVLRCMLLWSGEIFGRRKREIQVVWKFVCLFQVSYSLAPSEGSLLQKGLHFFLLKPIYALDKMSNWMVPGATILQKTVDSGGSYSVFCTGSNQTWERDISRIFPSLFQGCPETGQQQFMVPGVKARGLIAAFQFCRVKWLGRVGGSTRGLPWAALLVVLQAN